MHFTEDYFLSLFFLNSLSLFDCRCIYHPSFLRSPAPYLLTPTFLLVLQGIGCKLNASTLLFLLFLLFFAHQSPSVPFSAHQLLYRVFSEATSSLSFFRSLSQSNLYTLYPSFSFLTLSRLSLSLPPPSQALQPAVKLS